MIYLPDTNAFSAHLASKSAALSARLKVAQQAGELRLSAMVLAELEFGAEKARVALGETLYARRVRDLCAVMPPEPARRVRLPDVPESAAPFMAP